MRQGNVQGGPRSQASYSLAKAALSQGGDEKTVFFLSQPSYNQLYAVESQQVFGGQSAPTFASSYISLRHGSNLINCFAPIEGAIIIIVLEF